MTIDFRNINSQEALQALFECTSFHEYNECSFGDGVIEIHDPDEDGQQFVWIPECQTMGCVTILDMEHHGYDALFVQTIVQLFRDGKIKFA